MVDELERPVVSDIQLHTKTEKDLSEVDLADLRSFADAETESAIEATSSKSEGWEDLWEAAYVHSKAATALKSPTSQQEPFRAILARDAAGNLVGYSVVSIDMTPSPGEDTVKGTYLGVKRAEQGRGIGSKLLKARLQQLKSLGVKAYKTSARPVAIRLYDKLGIRYTSQAHPNHPEAKDLTVYID